MHRRQWIGGSSALFTAGLLGCRRARSQPAIPPTAGRPSSPSPPPKASEPTPESRRSPESSESPEERFAELRGFCDGVAPPDAEERAAHREAVRRWMTEVGAAAVVLEPGVDMQYLTGVRWGLSERPFLLVVPRTGQPVWIGPAFEEDTARERLGADARYLPWREHQNPYLRAAEALKGRRGPIALGPTMRTFVAHGLARALGQRRIRTGWDLVGRARMRKQPVELARLRRANEATKAALTAAAPHVRPGMTESELSDLIRGAQQAAGLEQVWVLALFGPHAAYPHGTRDRRPLRDRDFILVDTGGSLHGYRSDITRTWALGKPPKDAVRAWETVQSAQDAALEHIRPGVPCAEPDRVARAVIEKAGWGPNDRFFTHRLGHGIGLQVHEAPYLVRGNERRLEPGMTMSNEPGIYVPEQFGIRIEDIVAVTEDGHEVFGARASSMQTP